MGEYIFGPLTYKFFHKLRQNFLRIEQISLYISSHLSACDKTRYLPTSSNFQSSSCLRIFHLDKFGHKAMHFAAIKIFFWVPVVKLELWKPVEKVM